MTTEPRIKHRFPPKSQDPFPSQFGRTASRSDPGRQGRWFPPLDPRDYSFGAGPAASFFLLFFFLLAYFRYLSDWIMSFDRHQLRGDEKGEKVRDKEKKRGKNKKSEVLRHQIVAQFSLASTPSFYFVVRIDKPAAKGSWGPPGVNTGIETEKKTNNRV